MSSIRCRASDASTWLDGGSDPGDALKGTTLMDEICPLSLIGTGRRGNRGKWPCWQFRLVPRRRDASALIHGIHRDTPVAHIVPIRARTALRIRKPLPGAPPLNQIPTPKPANLNIDIVTLLLEERQSHR